MNPENSIFGSLLSFVALAVVVEVHAAAVAADQAVVHQFYVIAPGVAYAVSVAVIDVPEITEADTEQSVRPGYDFFAGDGCGNAGRVIDAPAVIAADHIVAAGEQDHFITPDNAVASHSQHGDTSIRNSHVAAVPQFLPIFHTVGLVPMAPPALSSSHIFPIIAHRDVVMLFGALAPRTSPLFNRLVVRALTRRHHLPGMRFSLELTARSGGIDVPRF